MNNKILRVSFYTIISVFVAVLAFFIAYNPQWLIGDDAIIIRHTGWGHFFNPVDTVTPSAGRFYPLAYFLYNILPIFHLSSVGAHWGLHTIVFLVFAIASVVLAQKAFDNKQTIWTYLAVLATTSICIQRGYNAFLDGFSTIWIDYTLVVVWAIATYFVHTKQSKMAAIIGFLSISYFTYCLEANFTLPLCYGVIGLVFVWGAASKFEKGYLWSMVATAILFLSIYFFTCFLHIEQAYDGSHGSEVTLLGNAIKMLIAQKVLLFGLPILAWRMYCVFCKKEQFVFWDTMIVAAYGFCCGCAILKLNWVMYYSIASIYMMPALAHYLVKYLNEKVATAILILLALFMCRTLPKYIKDNQGGRTGTTEQMAIIEEQYRAGHDFYWYEPTDDREWCFDMEIRAWLRESLQTQIGWQVGDEAFKLNVITEFCDSVHETGIYFVSKQNEKLFPGINEPIVNAGEVLYGDSERDIQTILIK